MRETLHNTQRLTPTFTMQYLEINNVYATQFKKFVYRGKLL